jgi:hypothetical protein
MTLSGRSEAAHIHDPHFFHGVVGPVGEAKVRGADDFVGTTYFIDHLLTPRWPGLRAKALYTASNSRRSSSSAARIASAPVRATSRRRAESPARRGARCDEEARKICIGNLAPRVHPPVFLCQRGRIPMCVWGMVSRNLAGSACSRGVNLVNCDWISCAFLGRGASGTGMIVNVGLARKSPASRLLPLAPRLAQ